MSERPLVIDGFASVQAVRRSGGREGGPRFAESRTRLAGPTEKAEGDAPASPGRRIGHSVIPDTYEIVCYACSYTFELRGKLRKTFCPKCREELDIGEHTIDREFSGHLRTIGTVTVVEGGLIKDAHIVTGDLILDGHLESGTIKVCRQLVLGPHAAGAIHTLTPRDICVREDAKLSLRSKLRCMNIDVRGELRAPLEVANLATVKPGGCLRGSLKASRLLVHEGGGLKATLHVAAGTVPVPPEHDKHKAKKHASETRSRTRTGSPDTRRRSRRTAD